MGGVEGVDEPEQHQSPAVRVCEVTRPGDGGGCGFHLTRTKWDPYPWVCGVDLESPACRAGLQVGDCVLEVNGEDVLGLRVSEIASRVRMRGDTVTMLLWSPGTDPACDPESLCCGPMPTSLQRLSVCMNAILSVLECPVCLDTIAPPAHQCANGHLICRRCRAQSERCPVCRLRLGRGRSLLADKVFNSLTEAFQLKEEPAETRSTKIRQRLNGKKNIPEIKIPVAEVKPTPKNKFLSRILGKSSSVENLSTSKSPNTLAVDDFNSTLKTKSLSSSEIFNQNLLSPAVSQNSLLSANTTDVGFTSSRSYQGSLESLTQRVITDFGDLELTDDGAVYQCPYTSDCTARLRKPLVFRHLQHEHSGPLVQYFTSDITMDYPPLLPESSLITIANAGNIYFLKFMPNNLDEIFLWMWVLGGKFKAEVLKLNVTLKSDDPESPELTYRTSVLPLSTFSWADAKETKKGVMLKEETVTATFGNKKVKLHLNVTSKATQAMPV